jgi:hypothetical protein
VETIKAKEKQLDASCCVKPARMERDRGKVFKLRSSPPPPRKRSPTLALPMVGFHDEERSVMWKESTRVGVGEGGHGGPRKHNSWRKPPLSFPTVVEVGSRRLPIPIRSDIASLLSHTQTRMIAEIGGLEDQDGPSSSSSSNSSSETAATAADRMERNESNRTERNETNRIESKRNETKRTMMGKRSSRALWDQDSSPLPPPTQISTSMQFGEKKRKEKKKGPRGDFLLEQVLGSNPGTTKYQKKEKKP